ncbi:MAG: ATP-binding protein [Acidobacteria bacterium]|nr:ATP-binding protein [Acidobacteriota bacterium]
MRKEAPKKHSLRAVPNDAERPKAADIVEPSASDICPKCYGSGMEVVPGLGARICECRKRDAHSVRLAKARIPKRYEKCHFNSYQSTANESQKRALNACVEFANKYPAVDHGILLTGPVGVGKTHLAVSIIKGLTERGFPGLFYEFGSLLKEIQDSYNPNTRTSESGILAPVLNADVLVLDELGSSKPTDWVQDTMYHVINSRYNDRKFTIFTTNYPDERPSDGRETLEDRIGVRARSRMFEMCRTIRLDGDDYRRRL